MKNKTEIRQQYKYILSLATLSLIGLLLYSTVQSSINEGIFDAITRLWPDKWFQTTIYDFYNNQLLIWLWISLRSRKLMTGMIFLPLCICFGSFISLGYFLYALWTSDTYQTLLLGKKSLTKELK